MQETPQEYIQRILAQLGGKDPLKVQAGTAAKLGRLVQRASAAKLRKRPAPGKWSAGRNPRAPCGLRNRHGLADAADSGRARNADPGV